MAGILEIIINGLEPSRQLDDAFVKFKAKL